VVVVVIMHMVMIMMLTSGTQQHMQVRRLSLMAVQHGCRSAQAEGHDHP
jgi:hypothetical protein